MPSTGILKENFQHCTLGFERSGSFDVTSIFSFLRFTVVFWLPFGCICSILLFPPYTGVHDVDSELTNCTSILFVEKQRFFDTSWSYRWPMELSTDPGEHFSGNLRFLGGSLKIPTEFFEKKERSRLLPTSLPEEIRNTRDRNQNAPNVRFGHTCETSKTLDWKNSSQIGFSGETMLNWKDSVWKQKSQNFRFRTLFGLGFCAWIGRAIQNGLKLRQRTLGISPNCAISKSYWSRVTLKLNKLPKNYLIFLQNRTQTLSLATANMAMIQSSKVLRPQHIKNNWRTFLGTG